MPNPKLDHARASSPELKHWSDGELAAAIWEEHHTDEPIEEFALRIDFPVEEMREFLDVPGTRPPADPRPEEVQAQEPPSEPAALSPPRPPEEELLDTRRAQDAALPFTRRTAATAAVRPREPGLVTPGEQLIHGITKGSAVALGNTAAKAINLIPPGLSRIYGGPNPEIVARDVETWLRETTAMHPDPVEMGEGWYNPASPNFLKGLDKSAPGISGHLAQFMLPYLVGVRAGAPRMLAAFGAGATAFDTQSPRLSNLIQEAEIKGFKLANPVTKYMEAKPGDTMAFGALMNGLEFAGLDLAFSTLFAGGLKLHKVARNAARRGQNVERAVELARRYPGYDDLLELNAATKMLDDVPPVGTGTVLRPPGVKGKIAKAVTKKAAKGALPQQEPLVAAKELPDPLDLPSSPEYTAPETLVKMQAGKTRLEKLARAEDPTAHASQFDQRKFDALVRDLEKGRMDPRAGMVRLPSGSEIKEGAKAVKEGAKAVGLPAVKGFDKLVRPIKSRIIAAHPVAGPRASTILDFFELEQNIIAHEAYEKLEPLLRMYTRLKKADKAAWNSAYKRNDMPKLYDIATKYERNKINPGMRAELTNTREAFDQMHELAKKHGMELAYHESTKGAADYLPLKVRNYKKFREHGGLDEFEEQLLHARKAYAEKRLFPAPEGGSPFWKTEFLKPFKAPNYEISTPYHIEWGKPYFKYSDKHVPAQLGAQGGGRLKVDGKTGKVTITGRDGEIIRVKDAELTDHMINEEIYKFLRAKESGGAARPGRRGESFAKERKIVMTKDLEPLYGDFAEVVSDYPRRLGYALAKKRLMGQVPGAEQQGYMQVLKQMRKDGTLTEAELSEVGGEIAELIGIRLRGGERGISNFAKGYRDFVYATTIANPFSTLTQSSEFMLNAYRNGWINNLAGTGKASLDNLPVWMRNALKVKDRGVRLKDLGISDVGAEYRGGGAGKISGSIHKLLNGGIIKGVKVPGAINLSGFKKMDVLMKESNLNGALRKAQKQLGNSKGAAAFEKRMRPFYGDETEALMQGIKSGNKNDLTRLYLYQELAKTQPLSLSEMPQTYLKSGGFGRSMYFLKSFGLKQMETMRRDVLRQLGSGDKKVAAEGVYNLLSLGLLFGAGTAGQNMLKDWIAGRYVTGDEYLLESGMNLIGLSRYNVYDFRRHGPEIGTYTIFAPPAPGLKEAWRGDFESLHKYWPGGGKLWHWRYGAGAKREAEDRDRRSRNYGKLPNVIDPLPPPPEISAPVGPVMPKSLAEELWKKYVSPPGTGTVLRPEKNKDLTPPPPLP